MRKTELKINGEKREASLAAGGQGFKIYSVSGLEGWALVLGKKTAFIAETAPLAQVVADYVNLRYHSLEAHEEIKTRFKTLVDELVRNQDSKPENRTLLKE